MQTDRRLLLALLALLAALGGAPARALCQGSSPPSLATFIDSTTPAALTEFDAPGAAVALIRDGAVVWARGYGLADRVSGRRVTPTTVFNVGSISKTATAWGVLRLVERGRLDLDAPADTYLTRWHLPPSAFDRAGVTIRRLLSHTAGLSAPGYVGRPLTGTLPTLEQSLAGGVDAGSRVHVVAAPGTAYAYSGGGYTVLQLIVEEVTGRSFADEMRTDLFTPLHMTHTAFAWPNAKAADIATPYDAFGAPIPRERFTELAAAGLQTTVEDLARLVAAELRSPAGAAPGRGVLRADLVRLMDTVAPQAAAYGLAHDVVRDSATGMTFVGHTGANTGWRAAFELAPATGDGIVILTNSPNGWPVVMGLVCRWERSLGAAGTVRYCGKLGARYPLLAAYAAGGVGRLLARYDELRRAAPDRYDLGEAELLRVAYDLLHAGKTADVVAVFEFNAERFPESWNNHDSLAEAYLTQGDTARAILHYRRSVELNPENANGVSYLKRLQPAH